MTKQEIKDRAPDGATHTVTEFEKTDYVKHECGNWYVWQNESWVRLHPIVVKEYRSILKPL